MLEYDWLLTALTYGLISCFRSKLSDQTCPIRCTNICDWTGQIGQERSKLKLSISWYQPINSNYLAHPGNQNQGEFLKYLSKQLDRSKLKTDIDEITGPMTFIQICFPQILKASCQPLTQKVSRISLLTKLIGNRTSD